MQCLHSYLLNLWRSAALDSVFRRWRARPWRRSQAAFTSSCFNLIKGSSGWLSFERKQMLELCKGERIPLFEHFLCHTGSCFVRSEERPHSQILKFTLSMLPSSNLIYVTKSRNQPARYCMFCSLHWSSLT